MKCRREHNWLPQYSLRAMFALLTSLAIATKVTGPSVVGYIETYWFASDNDYDQIRRPVSSLVVELFKPDSGEADSDNGPPDLAISETMQPAIGK